MIALGIILLILGYVLKVAILQTLGVISGRSATSRFPLSVKLKSWPSISSPDFAL